MVSPLGRACGLVLLGLGGAQALRAADPPGETARPVTPVRLQVQAAKTEGFFQGGGALGAKVGFSLDGLPKPAWMAAWEEGLVWQGEAKDQLLHLRDGALWTLTLPVPCGEVARDGQDLWALGTDGQTLVRAALPERSPAAGAYPLRTNAWHLPKDDDVQAPARGLVLAQGRLWRAVNLSRPKGHARLEGWEIPGWCKAGQERRAARSKGIEFNTEGRVLVRLTQGPIGDLCLWDTQGMTAVALSARKGPSRPLRFPRAYAGSARVRTRTGVLDADPATGQVRLTLPGRGLEERLDLAIAWPVEGQGGIWALDPAGDQVLVYNPAGFVDQPEGMVCLATSALAGAGLEQLTLGPGRKLYLFAREVPCLMAIDPGGLRAAPGSWVGLDSGSPQAQAEAKAEVRRRTKRQAVAQAEARKRAKAEGRAHAAAQARARAEASAARPAALPVTAEPPAEAASRGPEPTPDLLAACLARYGAEGASAVQFRRGVQAGDLDAWIRATLADPASDRVQDHEGAWWVTRRFPDLVGWLEQPEGPVQVHRLAVKLDGGQDDILDACPVR